MSGSGKEGNTVDKHVGDQMRRRRLALNIEREELARAMSVSIAQIDKWESGRSRIGSAQLMEISKILGVGPQYFFEA
jgi:transcriptional regulator with XRE-family HTH domain